MNWLWQKTSFNCETCGDYAVTGHKGDNGPWYIAWHRPRLTELGNFDNAADAKAACVAHSEEAK